METSFEILQKIQNTDIIPDAFEKWKDYRKAVTDFILANSEDFSSVLILGAGESNDIDLNVLAKYYDKIYLADKNQQAMNLACDRFNVKCERIYADFVGINEEAYQHFISLYIAMFNQQSLQENRLVDIASYLGELVRNYLNKAKPVFTDIVPKPGMVVAVGVHSQLLNVFPKICEVLSAGMPVNPTPIYNSIFDETDSIIKTFNDYIINSSGSRIVIGTEDKRVNFGDTSPIHGAWQGYQDMAGRVQIGELSKIDETDILWNFSKDKKYSMKFGCYEI